MSVLLHTLLIAAILWPATHFLTTEDPGNPFLAPGGGGGGGGGGGETVAYISLPAFTPPPPVVEEEVEVPPVETLEVPEVPEPEPVQDTVVVDTQVVATASGTSPGAGTGGTGEGGGQGGQSGTGTGEGTGPGTGPGSGGGAGFGQPPKPKQMILPPEGIPRDLKRQTILIQFAVTAEGRVASVEFSPEIRNRDYASKFRERLLDFVFVPARAPGGDTVAAKFEIAFTFF